MPSLQDQLDAITARTRSLVQPDRLAISEGLGAELFATGIEDRVLALGATAPEFMLQDSQTGKPVRSSDLLALGPVVVKFFRGRWDPYCVTELETWRDLYPQLRERGALFVAISPQTPDYALSDVEKKQLTFPVLTDKGNRVARDFKLVFAFLNCFFQIWLFFLCSSCFRCYY